MRRFLIAVVAIFAAAQAVPSQAAPPRTGLQIQHVEGSLPGGGVFKNGTLLIQGIFPSGLNSQQLNVVGTISGIAVVNGAVQHISDQPFSTLATLTTDPTPNAVTAQQQTSCSILHLDLGPISLNLLGLMLTTNEIVINLTAIPNGPNGGLLGSLLCALANALSAPGSDLTALINQLNALLNSVLTTLAL